MTNCEVPEERMFDVFVQEPSPWERVADIEHNIRRARKVRIAWRRAIRIAPNKLSRAGIFGKSKCGGERGGILCGGPLWACGYLNPAKGSCETITDLRQLYSSHERAWSTAATAVSYKECSMSPGTGQYREVERAIDRVLSLIDNQPKPNLTELAKTFDVPYERLRRRFNGKPSRSTRQPAGKKLDSIQENEILSQISQLDISNIRRIADQILRRDRSNEHPPPTVSYKWCVRFVQRHRRNFKGKGKINSQSSQSS